jgi:Fe-S cluster assembly protein SufD
MSTALSLENAPASGAHLPAWFRDQQRAAAELYETLPQPSRREESWRFANLQAVDLQDFAPARPVAPSLHHELLERSQGVAASSPRLVFANDQLLSAPASLLPEGVLFLPLAEALEKHPDLIREHFMREDAPLGSRKFAALHRSSVRNGSFLWVPKNNHLALPIQTFHWLAGAGQAVFPHTLIVAEENSSLTFIDWLHSADSAAALSCGVNDLWVGKNSTVRYVSVQSWNRQVTCLQSNLTQVAEGGNVVSLNLHLGGKFARSESLSRLLGQGARSEMLALSVADSDQEFDQRTLQDHLAPHTSSDLLYKNALYDTAKTIFSGLIRVGPQAHETDAYQKVRNLVLSDEAEANSMPGLEILADKVRCSHGATTGEIHPEELFYLQSRGIPKKTALGLITFGFLNEVLVRFPDNAVREALQTCLQERLQGH